MPKKWWKLSVMSVILISSSPGASTNDAPRGKAHRMVYRCAFNLRAVRKQNGIGFSSTGMCCETRQDAFRMWADEYVEIHWAFGSDEDNRRSSRGSAVNIELRLKTVKMDKFFFFILSYLQYVVLWCVLWSFPIIAFWPGADDGGTNTQKTFAIFFSSPNGNFLKV